MVIVGGATPRDTRALNLNGLQAQQKPVAFLWLLRPMNRPPFLHEWVADEHLRIAAEHPN
jgi:hypothetical protein